LVSSRLLRARASGFLQRLHDGVIEELKADAP